MFDRDALDPLRLSRAVERATDAFDRFDAGLAGGAPLPPAALDAHLPLTNAATFHRVADLDVTDPLREPLQRWVWKLAVTRVNARGLEVAAIARRQATHVITLEREQKVTVGELVRRMVADPERASGALSALREVASDVSAYEVELWQRRQEVARRLHLSSPDSLELPTPELTTLADQWLDDTAGLAAESLDLAREAWLPRALGRNSRARWPARISARRLEELLGRELTRDVPLVEPRWPDALGAASFLRALHGTGGAWRRALTPRQQPFVVARDPFGLEEAAFGALFALLPLDRNFLERKLEVPRDAHHDELRVVAWIVLLATRLEAIRVLLRQAALHDGDAFRELQGELSATHLGHEWPRELAGVLPRVTPHCGQRLAGWWLAASRAQQLQEDHDEDWYRNPRAADELRAAADRSPRMTVPADELRAGAGRLRDVLGPLVS